MVLGTPIDTKGGTSRWFVGTVRVDRHGRWLCPTCDTPMKDTGIIWPTSDPGLHHRCPKCGLLSAVHASALFDAQLARSQVG